MNNSDQEIKAIFKNYREDTKCDVEDSIMLQIATDHTHQVTIKKLKSRVNIGTALCCLIALITFAIYATGAISPTTEQHDPQSMIITLIVPFVCLFGLTMIVIQRQSSSSVQP